MITELRKGDIVKLSNNSSYTYKVLAVVENMIFISDAVNKEEYSFTTNIVKLNRNYPNAQIIERELEKGELYYYINSLGEIYTDYWFEDFQNSKKIRHTIRKNANNIFRTSEDAQAKLNDLIK